MQSDYKNLDCRNFAALDVVKGICHAKKELVFADGKTCELFDKLPKCKHCQHYHPSEEAYLGNCAAVSAQPLTYPDLCGVTCEHFAWNTA
jgi:hypothetical protein